MFFTQLVCVLFGYFPWNSSSLPFTCFPLFRTWSGSIFISNSIDGNIYKTESNICRTKQKKKTIRKINDLIYHNFLEMPHHFVIVNMRSICSICSTASDSLRSFLKSLDSRNSKCTHSQNILLSIFVRWRLCYWFSHFWFSHSRRRRRHRRCHRFIFISSVGEHTHRSPYDLRATTF